MKCDVGGKFSKEKYNELRRDGLCVVCGKPTQDGKALCQSCSLRQCNRNIAKYNKRKEDGVCTVCGARPATKGILCQECYSKYSTVMNAKNREACRQRGKRIRDERRAAGLCIRCGASKGDSPTTYCPECREKINTYAREKLRKRREAAQQ